MQLDGAVLVAQLVNTMERPGYSYGHSPRIQRTLDIQWQVLAEANLKLKLTAREPSHWKLCSQPRRVKTPKLLTCRARSGHICRVRGGFWRYIYLLDRYGRVWKILPRNIANVV